MSSLPSVTNVNPSDSFATSACYTAEVKDENTLSLLDKTYYDLDKYYEGLKAYFREDAEKEIIDRIQYSLHGWINIVKNEPEAAPSGLREFTDKLKQLLDTLNSIKTIPSAQHLENVSELLSLQPKVMEPLADKCDELIEYEKEQDYKSSTNTEILSCPDKIKWLVHDYKSTSDIHRKARLYNTLKRTPEFNALKNIMETCVKFDSELSKIIESREDHVEKSILTLLQNSIHGWNKFIKLHKISNFEQFIECHTADEFELISELYSAMNSALEQFEAQPSKLSDEQRVLMMVSILPQCGDRIEAVITNCSFWSNEKRCYKLEDSSLGIFIFDSLSKFNKHEIIIYIQQNTTSPKIKRISEAYIDTVGINVKTSKPYVAQLVDWTKTIFHNSKVMEVNNQNSLHLSLCRAAINIECSGNENIDCLISRISKCKNKRNHEVDDSDTFIVIESEDAVSSEKQFTPINGSISDKTEHSHFSTENIEGSIPRNTVVLVNEIELINSNLDKKLLPNPLLLAAAHEKPDTFQKLVRCKALQFPMWAADCDQTRNNKLVSGDNLFHVIARNDCTGLLCHLTLPMTEDEKLIDIMFPKAKTGAENQELISLLNTPNCSGFTPCQLACHLGNISVAMKFIQLGAKFIEKTPSNNNLLHMLAARKSIYIDDFITAINQQKTQEKKAKRKKNKKLNEPNIKKLINEQNKAGLTPLHIACQQQNTFAIYEFLLAGADKSIKNQLDNTALDIANKLKDSKTKQLIIQLLTSDNTSLVTLYDTVYTSSDESVNEVKKEQTCKVQSKLLVLFSEDTFAEVNPVKTYPNPFFVAASRSDSEMFEEIIAENKVKLPLYKISEKCELQELATLKHGDNLFHVIARNNSLPTLEYLSKHWGELLLHNPPSQDTHEHLIGMLNTHNADGLAPLHLACAQGNINLVLKLIDLGAVLTQKTGNQNTIIHTLIEHGHHNVIALIINSNHLSVTESSMLLNAVNTDSCSALHIACKKHDLPSIWALLILGVDKEIRDNNNKTVLDWANELPESEEKTLIVKMLIAEPSELEGLDSEVKKITSNQKAKPVGNKPDSEHQKSTDNLLSLTTSHNDSGFSSLEEQNTSPQSDDQRDLQPNPHQTFLNLVAKAPSQPTVETDYTVELEELKKMNSLSHLSTHFDSNVEPFNVDELVQLLSTIRNDMQSRLEWFNSRYSKFSKQQIAKALNRDFNDEEQAMLPESIQQYQQKLNEDLIKAVSIDKLSASFKNKIDTLVQEYHKEIDSITADSSLEDTHKKCLSEHIKEEIKTFENNLKILTSKIANKKTSEIKWSVLKAKYKYSQPKSTEEHLDETFTRADLEAYLEEIDKVINKAKQELLSLEHLT